ncbi:helix-turn-helix domain-containing protein [Enterococcus nangangensis]|uniref:helix-turn-helix domain-containing protein n=1 Tax=Enterococcus nangangensis TaxID=2559926 RepID=UPI0010F78DB9|nr:helix-turn-helix transcriptional regulator [Enterococcus nangangensis]
MDVGERLKERRGQLHLTQEEVAEKMAISRQTISNWENGRSYPDIERMVRLSELYQLSLDELLKGDQQLVNHLQAETNVQRWLKIFVGLLLLNVVLMVSLLCVSPMGTGLFYLLFACIGVLTLTIFYLIIKKI